MLKTYGTSNILQIMNYDEDLIQKLKTNMTRYNINKTDLMNFNDSLTNGLNGITANNRPERIRLRVSLEFFNGWPNDFFYIPPVHQPDKGSIIRSELYGIAHFQSIGFFPDIHNGDVAAGARNGILRVHRGQP